MTGLPIPCCANAGTADMLKRPYQSMRSEWLVVAYYHQIERGSLVVSHACVGCRSRSANQHQGFGKERQHFIGEIDLARNLILHDTTQGRNRMEYGLYSKQPAYALSITCMPRQATTFHGLRPA